VAPSWLAELVQPLTNDPTIGLTTSKIVLLDDRSTINACGNEISLCGITWCRGAGQPASMFGEDADVAAVSGCAFAIRADLFRRLGGFDERFFMYLEDTDLSWRARAAGYRCRFVAESIVSHDYRLTFSPAKIAQLELNRYRMLGKHLSLRSMVALTPVLALAEVLTWGYAAVRGPACLIAKARATASAVILLWPAVRSPRSAGEWRLLRTHRSAPPVVDGVGSSSARAIQATVEWLSRGAAAVGLALMSAGSDETRARPNTPNDLLSFDPAENSAEENFHAPEAAVTGAGKRRDLAR